jgi:hypothetical protein
MLVSVLVSVMFSVGVELVLCFLLTVLVFVFIRVGVCRFCCLMFVLVFGVGGVGVCCGVVVFVVMLCWCLVLVC